MSSIEPNKIKAIVRDFVDTINEQNWDKLDQLVAPNFVRYSKAGDQPEICNRDQLKAFLRSELETFPDAKESIEDMLAEGDKVAVRQRFQGTQKGWMGKYPPSGKKMIADYLAIYRIQDNQIVEAWAVWDNLNGLKQLGHFNPPA
ncbi:MAG TPA: ester cyclase [Cyanobacteria bacterium UBA11369]|nr:ester cyclase [Cyanobacteria bacterium UBA8543]HAZ44842.1 ester cyclase [Cyanobacteria bacterium UBA11371]HBE33226.1 ester cyclase [Cyanobacteria bacterium UBA11368]HBE51404.1 ester cyclase [Cyanobacteria bacterium UBA11369]